MSSRRVYKFHVPRTSPSPFPGREGSQVQPPPPHPPPNTHHPKSDRWAHSTLLMAHLRPYSAVPAALAEPRERGNFHYSCTKHVFGRIFQEGMTDTNILSQSPSQPAERAVAAAPQRMTQNLSNACFVDWWMDFTSAYTCIVYYSNSCIASFSLARGIEENLWIHLRKCIAKRCGNESVPLTIIAAPLSQQTTNYAISEFTFIDYFSR